MLKQYMYHTLELNIKSTCYFPKSKKMLTTMTLFKEDIM